MNCVEKCRGTSLIRTLIRNGGGSRSVGTSPHSNSGRVDASKDCRVEVCGFRLDQSGHVTTVRATKHDEYTREDHHWEINAPTPSKIVPFRPTSWSKTMGVGPSSNSGRIGASERCPIEAGGCHLTCQFATTKVPGHAVGPNGAIFDHLSVRISQQ